MNIGVIGAGNVGRTLGIGWAQAGHAVMFGSREPEGEKMRALLSEAGAGARTGSPSEAAAFGEVVAIALPYTALAAALPALGDLSGKVVVDCVNLVGPSPVTATVAAEVSRLLPGARVVKAFNTMGSNVMANPHFGAAQADNYICGDDPEAKRVVADLSRALGFEVVDAGPLASAALLEGLARLWIDLAYRQGFGREMAFKLLRR